MDIGNVNLINTRKTYNVSIWLLLVGNLIYLTIHYLEYRTITNVAPYFPVELEMPKTTLCFSIYFLLGGEVESGYSFDADEPPLSNTTFNQVFGQVPPASSILASCRYRDFELDILKEETDPSACYNVFQVTRFQMQSFMCYRFTFNVAPQYSYHAIVNSLYEPRELYHLNISTSLSEQKIIFPLIHVDELPDDDRSFNQPSFRESDTLFHVSYDVYESYSLPPPYDSNCFELSKVGCFQDCMDKLYKKFGYSPDGGIVMENTAESFLKPLSIKNDLNNTMFRKTCYNKCQYRGCEYTLINTRLSKSKPDGNNLIFVIETISSLVTKIEYVAEFDFDNYFTQMASLFGIWVGISVITSTKLLEKKEKHTFYQIFLTIKSHSIIVNQIINNKLYKTTTTTKPLYLNEKKVKISQKNNKFTFKYIILNIIKLTVYILYTWQLINVFDNYFLYKTTTKFDYDMNPKVILPSLTLCFTYKEFFQNNLTDVNEKNYDEIFKLQDKQFNFTLKNLFKLTPDEVIGGCYLRNWTDRFKRFINYNSTECLDKFKVKKFYSSQKICYLLIPDQLNDTYYQSDIRFLTKNPGAVYSILLGSQIRPPDRIFVLTHFSPIISKHSIDYMITAHRSKRKNLISISNRLFKVNFLPPPYDTFCHPQFGQSTCFKKCIYNKLSKLRRFLYASSETNNLPFTLLSYTDLINEKTINILRQSENYCQSKCYQDYCSYNYTLTFVTNQITVINSSLDDIYFLITLPIYPTSTMTSVALVETYDFIYQIACCCSFWLGLSVISLNPIVLLTQNKIINIRKAVYSKFQYLNIIMNKLISPTYSVVTEKELNQLTRKKIIKYLIYLFSFIGCSYQFIISIQTYLNYPSIVDVYEFPEEKSDRSLFICLDISELLSRKSTLKLQFDQIDEKSILLNRTIKQLFYETPNGDEIIDQCAHWGLNKRIQNVSSYSHVTDRIMFNYNNSTLCNKYFDVNKVIVQNYMCYSIRPKFYANWNRIQMKHTLHEQKVLFKVSINTSLLTHRYSVIVNHKKFYGFTSSTWSPNVIKNELISRYDVSYMLYNQSLLPSPYSSHGFTPFLFDRCLNECINNKFKRFNLTLSKRFTLSQSNIRFITYLDRRGRVAGKYIKTLLTDCEDNCVKYNPHIKDDASKFLEIFVPYIRPIRSAEDDDLINLTTFYLRSPNYPVMSIQFKLKISPFEQVINLGSIFSVWFGFAMIKLANFKSKKDYVITSDDIKILEKRVNILKQIHKFRPK